MLMELPLVPARLEFMIGVELPGYKWASDIDGEVMNDGSGYAVALSGDGSHVIIGTPFSDANCFNLWSC